MIFLTALALYEKTLNLIRHKLEEYYSITVCNKSELLEAFYVF